jgi:hypothetical protein
MKKYIVVLILVLVIIFAACVWKNHKNNSIHNTSETAAIVPSRSADAGCKWKPFEDQKVGIRMLTEDCSPQQYTYSILNNSIERQNIASPSLPKEKIVEIFTKPAAQTIQNAIQKQFIDTLPGTFSKTCSVIKNEKILNDSERYSIEPNPARKAILNTEAKSDIPNYSECGEYATDPDSEQYFEYQPNNSTTKFMFIWVGQETPSFDEDSIKLND